MDRICRLLGHWKRPFRSESPTSVTTGAKCRLCGAFLDLETTHKPEAVARFEAFTRSDYARQLAHGPELIDGSHARYDDVLARAVRSETIKEYRPMPTVSQSAADATSLRRACDNDDRPAMHTIAEGRGETRFLCCACSVVAGNPPADWHPDCMAADEAHPYTVYFYPEGKPYTVVDRRFPTEEEAEARAEALMDQGTHAFAIARRHP